MRLDEIGPGMRAMIALSGGFDSVWTLWKALGTGAEVHVHHLRLSGINGAEHREAYETAAARRVVDTLREEGHELAYTESIVDVGGIGQVFYSSFVAMPMVAIAARAAVFREGDRILVGANSSDEVTGHPDYRFQHLLWSRQFRGQLEGIYHGEKPPEAGWIEPAPTRRETVRDLPDNLVALASSCLFPKPSNGGYRPCLTCKKCMALTPYIRVYHNDDGRVWNKRQKQRTTLAT